MKRFMWVVLVVCVAVPPLAAQAPSKSSSFPSEGAPTPAATASSTPPIDALGACPPDFAEVAGSSPSGSPGRVWVEGELLLWFLRGDALPPLVTTSPSGTARTATGVLGQPGTTVLFGNQTVNDDLTPGFRLRSGMWLDDNQRWGLEGSLLYVGSESTSFGASSDQNPILARPFFNTQTNAPDSQLLAFPGTLTGNVAVQADRGELYGADANARYNLCCGCNYRLDLLAGYRFLRLTDSLSFQENLTATDPLSPVPTGTNITLGERFRTSNTFNGGQLGLAGEYRWRRLILGFRGLAAVGDLNRSVDIGGSTTVSVPGETPVTNTGSLLALPTNSGHFSSDQVAFATEVGLTLGYQITDHLRTSVGYSFLYLSNVVRAADQIDLTVNTTQLPPGTLSGVSRPQFLLHSTDFWAQGVTFSVEYRY
jgi:Putative beta barrel porin-7 (BBP7)